MDSLKAATIERYNRAKRLIDKNEYSIKDACRQAGISECWFYKIRKLFIGDQQDDQIRLRQLRIS